MILEVGEPHLLPAAEPALLKAHGAVALHVSYPAHPRDNFPAAEGAVQAAVAALLGAVLVDIVLQNLLLAQRARHRALRARRALVRLELRQRDGSAAAQACVFLAAKIIMMRKR